jgi:hypothetical protein
MHDIDFLSILFASSRFLSSKAYCQSLSRTFATHFVQTNKGFRSRFGNFAKNLTKAFISLTRIAKKSILYIDMDENIIKNIAE